MMPRVLSTVVLGVLLVSGHAFAAQAAPRAAEAEAYRDKNDNIDEGVRARGQAVYDGLCGTCHNAPTDRAPQRFILEQMAPESVHRALTTGVMTQQAAGLSAQQKSEVAQFITKRKFGTATAVKMPMCKGDAARFDRAEPPIFSGWGLDPASTHAIPTEVAGLTRANVGALKLKWAFAFPNALRARAQPALAGGAIYVGSHDGTVYALDRNTGCIRWTYNASTEVRTGMVVSPWERGDANAVPLLFFGDLVGNVYALNAVTGKQVWRKPIDTHASTTMTGAPTLHQGKLYVPVSSLEEAATGDPMYPCCTFRGSIVALDAASGAEAWRTYLVDEPKPRGKNSHGGDKIGPSGVPVWSSPAVDAARQQLYITTGDNYSSPATKLSDAVIALDLATGKINWAYQALANDSWNTSCGELIKASCPDENGPDFDFGAGAVLAKDGNGQDYVLAGAKSGEAYGIDPVTGKLKWKRRVGRGGVVGGIHFGLAAANNLLFVPISDVPDGKIHDLAPKPGISAIDIQSGNDVWNAPSPNACGDRPFCHPGYGGAITATPELVLAGGNDGYLRVFDAGNGKLLWEDDTTRAFKTVSGASAHGGSMGGGAAPIAYQGLLIMNSGYGFAGKMPGNVLLVYEVRN